MSTDRDEMTRPSSVKMFLTAEHSCSYFADRLAQNAVLDPDHNDQRWLYDFAITRGFRRSGDFIYRTRCANCQACQASRIVVDAFKPDRTQRRLLKRNSDLSVHVEKAHHSDEYFALYQRYLRLRHTSAGMDQATREDFSRFLLCEWATQEFITLRRGDELMALAITDVTASGLSAVYTCFAPECPERSLGVMMILQQIQRARELNLPYVYLGFWIKDHPKMHYKSRYRAFEFLDKDRWVCKS